MEAFQEDIYSVIHSSRILRGEEAPMQSSVRSTIVTVDSMIYEPHHCTTLISFTEIKIDSLDFQDRKPGRLNNVCRWLLIRPQLTSVSFVNSLSKQSSQ